MSERNGDKARYHRERKRKILHRTRIRELRKALERNKAAKKTRTPPPLSDPPSSLAGK